MGLAANTSAILNAMRADGVPADSAGRWSVWKATLTPAQSETMRRLERAGKCEWVPPGDYTYLSCLTMDTMMNPPGDTVMNDFPCELREHLEFIMVARGKVLVGGLGLGCVVRGLLARGVVESIDVIERCDDVIRLCGASVADQRVTIHKRDAYHGFVKGGPWDYAWWDLWSDPEKSEPHLQIIHMELVKRFEGRVKNLQGAWAMPRKFRRSLNAVGVML